MKTTIRIVIGVVLLLVILVAIAWFMIDRLAKSGIEKGGTYALGVDTTLQDIDISLWGGTLKMQGLRVANPADYETPHLMNSGTFDVGLDTGTLTSDTVVLNKFELDGMDVYIEQKGGTNNVSVVMDHVKKLGGEAKKPSDGEEPQPRPEEKPKEEPKAEKPGKRVKVDRIVIRNVVAHVRAPGLSAVAGDVTIRVPEIILTDVASDEGGVAMTQLMGQIVTAIMAAIVEQGGDILPKDLAENLTKDIAGAAGALGENAQKLVGQTSKQVSEAVGKQLEELQKGIADPNKVPDPGKLLKGLTGEEKTDGDTQPAEEKKDGGLLDGLLGG